MPMFKALKLCPNAVVIKGRMNRFRKAAASAR